VGWFKSDDTTRFSAEGRQFAGELAVDGRHYFDVPGEFARHALVAGLAPAPGGPPAPPAAHDRAALVEEIVAEVEARLREALGARPT
jgi:hypothetical protein